MIEIRTYDGDAAAFSRFSHDIWLKTYEGLMPLPLWDASYFEWQWVPEETENRDYLVVAYDGSKLVGSFVGEAFRFRFHDWEFDATMGSWLSVAQEYRNQGIGKRLFEEHRRQHLERGAVFQIGYGYIGSRASMGPRFWKRVPENTQVLGKVGFWARVFDHSAGARWNLGFLDRIGSRALGFVQSARPVPSSFEGIRPYRPEDLDDCLSLAHGLLENVDFGYLWSRERLARQLDHRNLPRTLVLEKDGRVAGFVNYYSVDFLARGRLSVGIIDLVAFGVLPGKEQRRLLRAAMCQMVDEGIKLALILRLPCYPWSTFSRTGFVARMRDFLLICVQMDPNVSLAGAKRFHVHWR